MPELLAFLPCKVAVVDQDENTYSVIAVMESIATQRTLPDGSPIPNEAIAQMEWVAFSHWRTLPTDGTDVFEQRFQVITPDGVVRIEGAMEINTSRRTFRGRGRMDAFPVGQEGEVILRVSLRKIAPEQTEWEHIRDYPVAVARVDTQDTTK